MTAPSEKSTILIIDDNPQFAADVHALTGEEFHLIDATSGESGVRKFSECGADLVLLDLKLGRGMDGLETLRRLKQIDPEVPVIMITEHVSLETAHQAGMFGAAQYCGKALSLKEIRLLIKQHLQNLPLRRAYNELLQQRPKFIGQSAAAQRLFADIETLAPTDRPVLITGESGTGKELVAQEIYRRSTRVSQPLTVVNCSNLSPELFENELFGHERGAFTNAGQMQKGKFELADGGTLFLDEIADLPAASQPKILRALENGAFYRVGGEHERRADVRVIAATNHDLEAGVKAGRFRQDLFYRLNHLRLHLPPLRERLDDLPLLVQYYLQYHGATLHKPVPEIPADLMATWQRYEWPGNVRELNHEIGRLVLYSMDGKIDRSRLQIGRDAFPAAVPFFQTLFHLPYEQAKEEALAQFQRDYFREHLLRHEGNMTQVAEATGVHRATIYRILHGSTPPVDETTRG